MLAKDVVVLGVKILNLTGHQQGNKGYGKAGLSPHGNGHSFTHTAHPSYVIIEHRLGQSGNIGGVFTGGTVGDVMVKMKGAAHGGGAGHLPEIQHTNKTTDIHSSTNATAHTAGHEVGSHAAHSQSQQSGNKDGKNVLASEHGAAALTVSSASAPASSNLFSIIKPDPMAKKADANGTSGGATSSTAALASSGETIHQYVEILQTPGRLLPHPWWTQCYNDRVHDCAPTLETFERDLKKHPISALIQRYRAKQESLNTPDSRILAVMMRLLGEMPINEGAIPFNHYMALEILLGMGFTPVHGLTSLAKRLVDVSPFLPSGGGQLGPHITYVARLGLHRLLAALLDVGNIRFTHDSAQFRDLLIEARNQPYSLVQILKRITSPLLKRIIALDCPQCGQLARAIHRLLTFKLPVPLEPLCLANGSHPTVPLPSELGTLSHGLNQPEQVMLARAVLYLVFDVPLFATNCPRCVDLVNTPQTDARTLVNAMLECYCTPHSKFHLVS